MKKLSLILAGAVTFGVSLSLATGAFAHHAFTSEYDISNKVTVTGTIVQMRWVNPHSWLTIDVKEADGKTTQWAVEFANPNQLLHRGFRKDDLPVGAKVTVEGFRARNGSTTANARAVVLADGKRLFASDQKE